MNLLTAAEPGGTTREGPLPLALPSDREAIEVALYSALSGERPRVARIHNTAHLEEVLVSESLMEEARSQGLSIESPPTPLAYDMDGNLTPRFSGA